MKGSRHGEGTMKYSSGSVYVGEWQNGDRTVALVFISDNSVRYSEKVQNAVVVTAFVFMLDLD